MKKRTQEYSPRRFSRVVVLLLSASLFLAVRAPAQSQQSTVLMQRRAFTNLLEQAPRPKKEQARRAHVDRAPVELPFHIINYRLLPAVDNFAASGFMGDVSDIRLAGAYAGTRTPGYPCLQVKYAAMGEAGWAGVMWQNPANNWGTVDGGYNLKNAKKLSFWAKGSKGGEVVEFILGGASSVFPDSDGLTTGEIKLTPQWKRYVLDVSNANLSYISSGFGFVLKQPQHPNGCTFYLDEVCYAE